MKHKILAGISVAAIFPFITQCGGSSSSSPTSISASDQSYSMESATSEAGSQAGASEGGAVGLLAACNYTSIRGACTSSADVVTYGGCTLDSGVVTMTGTWNETFSGTSSATCTVPIVSGETVVRTSSGAVATGPLGGTLTTDTNGGTAYDGTVIPSTGTSTTNTSGTRAITINGTHRALTASSVTLFDHYLVTTTPLSVTGSRAGNNRVIASGVIKLFHNLAKYTASSSFSNVTWGSSTCCFPTSGTITTTYSGAVTGTSTMQFTSTCGSATLTDMSGNVTTRTLTMCN